MGLDQSIFGPHLPAPIFQALVPRKAGTFDAHAHTFGTGDEPATFTRASDGLYRNSAGAWTVAAANGIRPDHSASGAFLGYLFESASTNEFLNSAAPVTQNIALGTGTFTLSVHGSGSVTSANGTGTASGHGAATEGSHVTFVVSGAGTFSFTVAGGPPTYVQVEEFPTPTSPIITQGTPETRAKEDLGWGALAGFSDAEGGIRVCWRPTWGLSDIPAGSSHKSNVWTQTNGTIGIRWEHTGGGLSKFIMRDGSGTFHNGADMAPGPVAGTAYDTFAHWSTALSEFEIGTKIAGSWSWPAAPGVYGGTQAHDAFELNPSAGLPIHLFRLQVFNRWLSRAEVARLFP